MNVAFVSCTKSNLMIEDLVSAILISSGQSGESHEPDRGGRPIGSEPKSLSSTVPPGPPPLLAVKGVVQK